MSATCIRFQTRIRQELLLKDEEVLFVFWGKIFGGVSPVLSKYGEI